MAYYDQLQCISFKVLVRGNELENRSCVLPNKPVYFFVDATKAGPGATEIWAIDSNFELVNLEVSTF